MFASFSLPACVAFHDSPDEEQAECGNQKLQHLTGCDLFLQLQNDRQRRRNKSDDLQPTPKRCHIKSPVFSMNNFAMNGLNHTGPDSQRKCDPPRSPMAAAV